MATDSFDRKSHWENIYQSKQLHEVSWYQPTPETSLILIQEYAKDKTLPVIDIGGGDSFLVDHLLDLGYTDITVLDISSAAIDRAKKRLGNRAGKVHWIIEDAGKFIPDRTYFIWHDRAAFHFLTDNADIDSYLSAAKKGIAPNGVFILGTFSENGPKKCSGIEIKQYNEQEMIKTFSDGFEKMKCLNIDHKTPFDTIQNFLFCCFRRKG